jgi:hypothetical protein
MLSEGVILCPSGKYRLTLAHPALHFALASRTLKGGEVVDAADSTRAGAGSVLISVLSDKRRPYCARPNRYNFDSG